MIFRFPSRIKGIKSRVLLEIAPVSNNIVIVGLRGPTIFAIMSFVGMIPAPATPHEIPVFLHEAAIVFYKSAAPVIVSASIVDRAVVIPAVAPASHGDIND